MKVISNKALVAILLVSMAGRLVAADKAPSSTPTPAVPSLDALRAQRAGLVEAVATKAKQDAEIARQACADHLEALAKKAKQDAEIAQQAEAAKAQAQQAKAKQELKSCLKTSKAGNAQGAKGVSFSSSSSMSSSSSSSSSSSFSSSSSSSSRGSAKSVAGVAKGARRSSSGHGSVKMKPAGDKDARMPGEGPSYSSLPQYACLLPGGENSSGDKKSSDENLAQRRDHNLIEADGQDFSDDESSDIEYIDNDDSDNDYVAEDGLMGRIAKAVHSKALAVSKNHYVQAAYNHRYSQAVRDNKRTVAIAAVALVGTYYGYKYGAFKALYRAASSVMPSAATVMNAASFFGKKSKDIAVTVVTSPLWMFQYAKACMSNSSK